MNFYIKSKVLEYLLLTFCISWISWGIIIISNNFGFLNYGTPLSMILFVVGGNGAPIAAYFLLRKWRKINNLKSFLKYSFNFKNSIYNYILVLLFLGIHFIVPIILVSTKREVPIYYGLIYIPIMIVGGGLEEIGWRGILQKELEKIFPFSISTLILSIIWAIWHLPLWFIIGTNQSGSSFLLFSISVVGLSFSLATILKITNSVFLCILFHSCINAFASVFVLQQNYSTFITMIVEIVLSFVILFLFNKNVNP